MKNRKVRDRTVNTALSSLRTFLYFCMDLGHVERFKIELIKAEKKVIETYTDSEVTLLLKKPNPRTCDFVQFRSWAIVNTLLATGCRLSTLTNLKVEDIDFENDMIRYQKTKNRKQQFVPLSPTLAKVIQEYLVYRKGSEEEYLFCSIYGGKLTKNALETSIRKFNAKRGVMKGSIHLFRHTFAKNWIMSSGDVFRLQKILGHSSLEIVKEYVRMFDEDLKVGFKDFNMVDRLTSKNEHIKMRDK